MCSTCHRRVPEDGLKICRHCRERHHGRYNTIGKAHRDVAMAAERFVAASRYAAQSDLSAEEMVKARDQVSRCVRRLFRMVAVLNELRAKARQSIGEAA